MSETLKSYLIGAAYAEANKKSPDAATQITLLFAAVKEELRIASDFAAAMNVDHSLASAASAVSMLEEIKKLSGDKTVTQMMLMPSTHHGDGS